MYFILLVVCLTLVIQIVKFVWSGALFIREVKIIWHSEERASWYIDMIFYRVSKEEGTKLWEGVPYVKLYRKTPKHLYPKLNCLGDNGNWELWTSFGSKNDSCQVVFLSTGMSARGTACERTFLRWLREVQGGWFIQCTRWYENAMSTHQEEARQACYVTTQHSSMMYSTSNRK
jgi:hypothetical protein